MEYDNIGPFEVSSLLGEGSFGKVYLCNLNGRLYSIKCIERDKIEMHPRYQQMMDRERQILFKLSKLNSPYISKVYTPEETQLEDSYDTLYLVFDYYNGGDILSAIQTYKNIDEKVVQHLTRQLVEGICLLHDNNIVHRDLKPANVMLHFDAGKNKKDLLNATVKITDFGFARELKEDDFAQSILGTPFYMDPKILSNYVNSKGLTGNKEPLHYDKKVDVWSLGAMVFHMLTGKPPFTSDQLVELKNKLEKGHYIIPGNIRISDEAISFLKSCLQNINEKRADIHTLRSHPFIKLDYSKFKFNFHDNHISSGTDTSQSDSVVHKDFSLSTYQFTQEEFQGFDMVYLHYQVNDVHKAKRPCVVQNRNGDLNVFLIIENGTYHLFVKYPEIWANYGYKRVIYVAEIVDMNFQKQNESSGDIEFPINKGNINVKTTAFHKIMFTMQYEQFVKYSRYKNGKYEFYFQLWFKLTS